MSLYHARPGKEIFFGLVFPQKRRYYIPVIHLFGGSPETLALAQKLFIFYCAFAMILYPTMNALPQALRSAGDARLTMLTSMLSMFLVWVGVAALLNRVTDLGVFSVWIAMCCDYLTRSAVYVFRYRGKAWLEHQVLAVKNRMHEI